jgi:hypothetical protein
MEVTVDGTARGTRQRVLAVPFAVNANTATVAQSLSEQSKTWRPSVLTGNIPSGGIATPSFVLPMSFSNGAQGDAILPLEFKILTSLEFTYRITWKPSYPTSASFQIIRWKPGESETVIESFTDQSNNSRLGDFKKYIKCKIDIDPAFIYKVRLSVGQHWASDGASIQDFTVSGKQ